MKKIISLLISAVIFIGTTTANLSSYDFSDKAQQNDIFMNNFIDNKVSYGYVSDKTAATIFDIRIIDKEISLPTTVMYDDISYTVKYIVFNSEVNGTPLATKTCEVLNIPETMVLWDNNDAKWKKLKAINIPQNSNLISIDGLNNLKKLERINIPKNLENLDGLANCPSMKISGIKISPENEYFKKSKKFLLSDKGKSVNNYFGKSKKVKIADGIISIKQHAFLNCKSIKAIAMPKGLKKIGYDAFKNCKSLSKVTIGNKKKAPKIETKAFKNTKDGIKFVVKNKKVAKSLAKQLKGSGVRNAKIVVKG